MHSVSSCLSCLPSFNFVSFRQDKNIPQYWGTARDYPEREGVKSRGLLGGIDAPPSSRNFAF